MTYDREELARLCEERAFCTQTIEHAGYCDNYTDAHRARCRVAKIDAQLVAALPAMLADLRELERLRADVAMLHHRDIDAREEAECAPDETLVDAIKSLVRQRDRAFQDGLRAALDYCKQQVASCSTPGERGIACRDFDCLAQSVSYDFANAIKRGQFGSTATPQEPTAAKEGETP